MASTGVAKGLTPLIPVGEPLVRLKDAACATGVAARTRPHIETAQRQRGERVHVNIVTVDRTEIMGLLSFLSPQRRYTEYLSGRSTEGPNIPPG